MLEKNNSGTLTRIKTAVDHSFLCFFIAFGHSRAGFNKVRSIVVVDGTHLKGKYKGTLYVAICFESNKHIFPLALGMVILKISYLILGFLRGLKRHWRS